jgi:hypothetical protein
LGSVQGATVTEFLTRSVAHYGRGKVFNRDVRRVQQGVEVSVPGGDIELPQFRRRFHGKRPDACAHQSKQRGSASQRFTQVTGQRSYVRTGRALDVQAYEQGTT